MFPLSAISQTHAAGMTPRVHAAAADLLPVRAPGVDAPAQSPLEIGQPAPPTESFGSLLGRMVEEVNTRQNAAADAVHSLQTGGNVPLHQAVIAMEEASISFQLMVEVRNKLLDSYQELMRMQI